MNGDYMKVISACEQAAANLGEFAKMLGAYQNQLLEAGFEREEALTLVASLQTVLFTNAFSNIPKPDENV